MEDEAMRLARYVEGGGRAIVLEQSFYPDGMPARLSGRPSTISFIGAKIPELFDGLSDEDLQLWRGDHIVARNEIMRPESGSYRPLLISGSAQGLGYFPALEIPYGNGIYILVQALLVEKFYEEPIAPIFLQRIINYATRPLKPSRPLAVLSSDPRVGAFLESLGLRAKGIGRGELKGFHGVLVVSADMMSEKGIKEDVEGFVRDGGIAIVKGIGRGTSEALGGILPARVELVENTSVVHARPYLQEDSGFRVCGKADSGGDDGGGSREGHDPCPWRLKGEGWDMALHQWLHILLARFPQVGKVRFRDRGFWNAMYGGLSYM